MLQDDEIREIEEEKAAAEHPRAACIDALRAVQRRRGWVSDEVLAEVAELLGMSVAELDDVASFYNLVYRRPVGRHVILVCDSVSCWIMGGERLGRSLVLSTGARPGETSADGRFTVLPVACLGACDRAPAIMIDEDLHADLAPEALARILERYE
ncbi:MAG: NADH-quinone oxidoreductase subunit NuoE [Deltaproteobacteria bacterium]|nr:NADH-quinone oxidoreductase subunit NuoE [Deltaproteobacteria bacterium]